MTDDSDLPIFQNPPVVEAALCAIFKPIPSLRALHFGVFWQKIKSDYPITEMQPPIPHQVEQLNVDPARPPQGLVFQLPFPFGEDNSRYQFVSGDRSRVVQLQRDRFITNWRKNSSSVQYPEYKKEMRSVFCGHWQRFTEFLGENQIDQPEIEQCEVTYVNHIRQGEGWNSLADLPSVISPWSSLVS